MSDDVVALERSLLDPATRADSASLERLLHPDFTEIGASGRRWTRESILAELADDPSEDAEMTEVAARAVAEGVVLVTYRAGGTLRSSLWVRDGGAWRILFHQGTPA